MKRFAQAAVAAFFIACVSSPALAKSAVLIRGIGGAYIAKMERIEKGLRAQGYSVDVREYYQGVPTKRYDLAVGHSAGAPIAMHTNAAERIAVDSIMGAYCPKGAKCTSFYAPVDKFPFLICCGGYRVTGAKNIAISGTPSFFIFAPGHVSAPDRVANDVLRIAAKLSRR